MRVGILGPLEVQADGRRLEVGGVRLRSLLARLALDAGRPVSAASLVDAVWDDDVPGDEVHALQALVSRLRRSLGDGGLVAQSAGGYALAVDPDGVDALRFERLAREGGAVLRDGDPPRAAATLRSALALWRGQALGELAGVRRFAAAEAARLEDLKLAALLDRLDADRALGGGAELVGELEALAAAHPLHERLAGQLMRALYAAGRQADALAVYERLRAQLGDELGVVPSPELQEIHLAVVRGEAAEPAAASAPKGNLPAALTSFVGRDAEVERVGALLERHRLVTLTGPGGAGKTRLASEVAAQRAPRDGAWLVELASVSAGADVAPTVLGSLGLREAQLLLERRTAGPRDAGEQLVDVLAPKHALLVLDNCEHLVAPVAELAERLLARCPAVRVLATSREPLGIVGESLATVAPLALPDGADAAGSAPAVRLFADRAAAARAGFAVDETNVATVAEVCRRLDGLPLAIELAAARLRAMSLEQLAERLDDRFRLLSGGRGRTLRAVMDWSWDLLSEPERRLARRLAVFPAGATVESAEAVCGDAGADVFDLLTALVDKSLVQIVERGSIRYRMLETVREYGLERAAEAGELDRVRDAHARHFAAFTTEAEPRLRHAEQLVWLARLTDERDNVLAALRRLGERGDAAAALRLAVDLLWFWLLSGSRDEVTTWVGFALSVAGDAQPADRAFAELVHAFASGTGPADDDWPRLRAAFETADLADRPLVATVRPLLALFGGERETADALLEASLRHPDPWVRASVPMLRAQIAENDGDVEVMRRELEAALATLGAVGDRWGLAAVHQELAVVRMLDGDLDAAEAAFERAQKLLADLGAPAVNAMLRMRRAELSVRRGDLAGARALLEEAHERAGEEAAIVSIALAVVLWRSGERDAARARQRRAVAELDRVVTGMTTNHARAIVLAASAVLWLEDGDVAGAERALADAYAAGTASLDQPVLAAVGLSTTALALHRGRPLEAAEALGAAARLRGAEDPTQPEVRRLSAAARDALGERAFADAYARGRALDREAAAARLDPAGVGAQRERDEEHEHDPHPQQGPQHV